MSDDAVAVEIHLTGNVGCFVVGYVVPLALHHVPDLVFAYDTVAVEVHRMERLVCVKEGISGELLARGLRLSLRTDHSPHQVFKGLASTVGEYVVLSIDIDSLVATWPSSEHLCIVGVIRRERRCKLPII